MKEDTLLIRCAGIMQSWGIIDRFTIRRTEREPTKSGVIGLLCATLGRPRSSEIADLVSLKMGVRVDFPGELKEDFQTAKQVVTSKGVVNSNKAKSSVTSTRYFLNDADFLVGLQGNPDILNTLEEALRKPVWLQYLGRKSYVPIVPVWIPNGLKKNTVLKKALLTYPWPRLLTDAPIKTPNSLKLVMESGEGEFKEDVPLSFKTRQYSNRKVVVEYVDLADIPRWS